MMLALAKSSKTRLNNSCEGSQQATIVARRARQLKTKSPMNGSRVGLFVFWWHTIITQKLKSRKALKQWAVGNGLFLK